MKVLKFGGTSVGKPERMKDVARLIEKEKPVMVVLSALSGTTNALVALNYLLIEGKQTEALAATAKLREHYQQFMEGLFATPQGLAAGVAVVDEHFKVIKSVINTHFSPVKERIVLAQGELLSTRMFFAYLQESGKDAALLPALEFMKTDAYGEPAEALITVGLKEQLTKAGDHNIYITQGYICRNDKGEIDNLKRGGSDYSASLIGAGLQSEEIQIWTDIDGMHNNDPRIVKRTVPVPELSFDEAAELAYFGAKILHPSSVLPARKHGIPVRLLNTMNPEAKGTVITNNLSTPGVKALAAKDGITVIRIQSGRMLLAYGFLKTVFEIFESHKTSVDVITTSEVAVSVSIDNNAHLQAIVKDLQQIGSVEVDYDQTIVCIVGNIDSIGQSVMQKTFHALENISVRMVSFGGSCHNVSLLVATEDKQKTLELLNESLFTWN